MMANGGSIKSPWVQPAINSDGRARIGRPTKPLKWLSHWRHQLCIEIQWGRQELSKSCRHDSSEGPIRSTFHWTRNNCPWHSILAFWSPNITYPISRKLAFFITLLAPSFDAHFQGGCLLNIALTSCGFFFIWLIFLLVILCFYTAGLDPQYKHMKKHLPANRKGYQKSETTYEKLSARIIQIFRVYFCLIHSHLFSE